MHSVNNAFMQQEIAIDAFFASIECSLKCNYFYGALKNQIFQIHINDLQIKIIVLILRISIIIAG
jgi:hypothetical protein